MERKAFNFFKSYYDVAKELNEKDRLAFYDALILEQFTGKKTDLKGMAKFAYISQQHSIDSQINGFNQRLKRGDTDLSPLSILPPAIGGTEGATIQGKEKGEVKGKVKEKDTIPTFFDFLAYAKTLDGYHNNLESSIKSKYDAWVVNDWKDGNDNKITNWKTKLINTLPYLLKNNPKRDDRNQTDKIIFY